MPVIVVDKTWSCSRTPWPCSCGWVQSSAQELGGSHTMLSHFHRRILGRPDHLYRMFSAASPPTSLKENIPPLFRSMVGISKLSHSLLPRDLQPSSPGHYRSIQLICFPPHHQDPPAARPKCKGVALLTLRTVRRLAPPHTFPTPP
jgi:hypothetical protein